eukprot:Nk52_evm8s335 gene=Nk52_evmTU8s335
MGTQRKRPSDLKGNEPYFGRFMGSNAPQAVRTGSSGDIYDSGHPSNSAFGMQQTTWTHGQGGATPRASNEFERVFSWVEQAKVSNPEECARILEHHGVDYETLFLLKEKDLEAMFPDRRGYVVRLREALREVQGQQEGETGLAATTQPSTLTGQSNSFASITTQSVDGGSVENTTKRAKKARSAPVDIHNLNSVHERYRRVFEEMKKNPLSSFKQSAVAAGIGPQTVRDRRYIAELSIANPETFRTVLERAKAELLSVKSFESICQEEFVKMDKDAIDRTKMVDWGRSTGALRNKR